VKFILEIELGNEAMQYTGHIADALRDVVSTLDCDPVAEAIDQTGVIRDINGNTVGKWEVTES
jgi:hypothetical protein